MQLFKKHRDTDRKSWFPRKEKIYHNWVKPYGNHYEIAASVYLKIEDKELSTSSVADSFYVKDDKCIIKRHPKIKGLVNYRYIKLVTPISNVSFKKRVSKHSTMNRGQNGSAWKHIKYFVNIKDKGLITESYID
jgi:hypothetical protein